MLLVHQRLSNSGLNNLSNVIIYVGWPDPDIINVVTEETVPVSEGTVPISDVIFLVSEITVPFSDTAIPVSDTLKLTTDN